MVIQSAAKTPANRIIELLETKSITPWGLAEQLDENPVQVYALLHRYPRELSVDWVTRVAVALDVPAEYLLAGVTA